MAESRKPIPAHLAKFDWYAPHLAWMIAVGYTVEYDAGEAKPFRADLSDAVLSRADLSDAVLSRADLSGAVLSRADLSGAVLRDADLRRADLSDAVLSRAVLSGAVLSRADLSGAVLSRAVLSRADLSGADLSGAVLSDAVLRGAVLRDADLRGAVLSGAVLSGAVLSGADLRGAVNVPAAPAIEHLDAKILQQIEAKPETFNMQAWHGDDDEGEACGTTHCRAGWAITLAGKEGKELEEKYGPSLAGALIYTHSRPGKPVPDFFTDNETALADIRKCAAEDPLTV